MHEQECESLQRKIDSGKVNLQALRHKYSDSRAEVRKCRRVIMKQEIKLSTLQKDHDELLDKFSATVYDLQVLETDCRNKTLALFRQEVTKLQQKVRNIKKSELAIKSSRQKIKSLHQIDQRYARTRLLKKQLIAQIEKLQRKIEASKDIEYRRELEERVRKLEENDKFHRNEIEKLKEEASTLTSDTDTSATKTHY